MVPELQHEDFGVLIEVLTASTSRWERALYWKSGGVAFAAVPTHGSTGALTPGDRRQGGPLSCYTPVLAHHSQVVLTTRPCGV